MSKDPHAKLYELQRLAELSYENARSMLAKQGSFLPGFIAVTSNGKYHLGVAAQGGVEGWNLLITTLRQKAREEHLRATAMYRDVRVRAQGAAEDVDAVQIVTELSTGESRNIFQVYRMSNGEPLFYDRPQVEEAPSVIFAEARRSAADAKPWWRFWN